MESVQKIRLSAEYILVIAVSFFMTLLLLILIIGTNTANDDYDLKTFLEYKVLLLITFLLFLYFITRPAIYHDENNLYIKKVNKKEIAIPLKNISSIFKVPFLGGRGYYLYSVEYLDSNGKENSIKFQVSYVSSKMTNFIRLVKEINPRVELVL